MSNDIRSEANSGMIKLGDVQVNIDSLDLLIDKKCKNSIFSDWESHNGNNDSIFSADEVNKLKTQIYQEYQNGTLSDSWFKAIFGKKTDSKKFANYLANIQKYISEPENTDNSESNSIAYESMLKETKEISAKLETATQNMLEKQQQEMAIAYNVEIEDFNKKHEENIKTSIRQTMVLKEEPQEPKASKPVIAKKTEAPKPQYPKGIQNKINELKQRGAKFYCNIKSDNTYELVQSSAFQKEGIEKVIRKYTKDGKLIHQTHYYKNGIIKRCKPDANGGLTQWKVIQKAYPESVLQKMKQLGKSYSEIIRNSDGTIDIIEKSDALKKSGILRRAYRFDSSGKQIKVIKYIVPKENKQSGKTQSMPQLNWGNKTAKWQPDVPKTTVQTAKSASAKSSPTKTQAQPAKPVIKKSSDSQVESSEISSIPGLETVESSPFMPKTELERAKHLQPAELRYPKKMTATIADMRAVGIECDIRYQEKDGSYVVTAKINNNNYKLINRFSAMRNNTVIIFDAEGNLKTVRQGGDGLGFEQVTNFDNGSARYSIEKKAPVKILNPKTHFPYAVEKQFNEMKLTAGDNIEMKMHFDGTCSIIRRDTESDVMQGLKAIEYRYDAEGNFQYQLNYSNQNESVLIGRKNNKSGKMDFKKFKNENGLITTIPDFVIQKSNEMRQCNGEAKIIRGKNTITIVQTKGQFLDANNIAKIVHKYDAFGKLLTQDITYNNGREINYYDVKKKGSDGAHIANPIKILLPEQYMGEDSQLSGIMQTISGLETKGPKDTAQRFAHTLENSKADLMKKLNLSNEAYDNLAILSMGIAEQESHFGQTLYKDTNGETHIQVRAWEKVFYNWGLAIAGSRSGHSQGVSQVNFDNIMVDPIVKKRLNAEGIYSFKDLDGSVEKQAKATMIVLASLKNVAEGETWQKRLRSNNDKINAMMRQGQTLNGKKLTHDDKLTTNDIIALLWNGAGGVVTRMKNGEVITINTESKEVTTDKQKYVPTGGSGTGYYINKTKTLKGSQYAKNVRIYASKFFATPKTDSPGYMHTTERTEQVGALGAQAQNNGGSLGEVVFMPLSYNNKWRVSSPQTKDELIAMIYKNSTQLSGKYKEKLIRFIIANKINFGNRGLTEYEAKSLLDSDVQLMANKIAKIKNGAKPSDINQEFAKEYLESRQFSVAKTSVNPALRIQNVRSSNPINSKYLKEGLSFEIHPSFYAGGRIKRHTARYTVQGGNDYQCFAVTRSQGVNPLLENGTLSPARDRVLAEYAEYMATHIFESGGHCKNGIVVDLEYCLGIDHTKIRGKGGKSLPHAKMLPEFYSSLPEVFEEVSYVDSKNVNNTNELNGTDINNLPCGYLGVFIPGKGFDGTPAYPGQPQDQIRNESGHAFISDGFGGCFADEHDNGKWAQFGNGKGEHGQLKVYRLTEDVVPVYSEKLGRTVLVPLKINPDYLVPEFRELQAQERKKRGLS